MSSIGLTAGWVAAAMHGALVAGDAAQEFSGVSIDSRTIGPGQLFIAIRGERFDGLEFVGAALERSAAGVVVPRGWSAKASAGAWSAKASAERRDVAPPFRAAVVIEVDDTTAALQRLAHAVRRESGTKVVAITGSAGKTTTKELTAELLSMRYRVIRNRGNFNNHIGLPLSLIELRERPEIAVVELGMNHAGEISTLVAVAEPEVRVWTNVGDAHAGFFDSVDAIADAKAEIFEGAAADTVLVANADDDRIVARLPRFAGRVSTFAIERDAEVRASGIVDRGVDGIAAQVTTPRGAFEMRLPLVGRANLLNALAATGVALQFDLPPDEIASAIGRVAPAAHRGEVVRLPGGVTVIDDSYNANPTATRGALDVLAGTAATRRVAVLGEMLELGAHAVAMHREVGRAAAQKRIDVLFTVGAAAAESMAQAAVAAGMPAAAVRHFGGSDEAGEAVAREVRGGDVVLVKGSRGVRTDRVVERLKAGR